MKRTFILAFTAILLISLCACGGSGQPAATPTPTLTETPTPELTSTPEPEDPYIAGEEQTVIAEGFFYVELNDALKARITGMSYPADDTNAKIHYGDLRYVRLLHYDFDGEVKVGELIVNKELAKEVTEIFYELYKAKYPLTSVKLVDDFGEPGDDNASMEANNTSAFNYRDTGGNGVLSMHAFGAAVDVNPLVNPYIHDGKVSPANGDIYVNRSREFPGKIDKNDLCYKLFTQHGWTWGGSWKTTPDYQHFAKEVSQSKSR